MHDKLERHRARALAAMRRHLKRTGGNWDHNWVRAASAANRYRRWTERGR